MKLRRALDRRTLIARRQCLLLLLGLSIAVAATLDARVTFVTAATLGATGLTLFSLSCVARYVSEQRYLLGAAALLSGGGACTILVAALTWQPRIALVALGSRGDVLPCATLGRALQGAGHEVRFATFEGFRELAAAAAAFARTTSLRGNRGYWVRITSARLTAC